MRNILRICTLSTVMLSLTTTFAAEDTAKPSDKGNNDQAKPAATAHDLGIKPKPVMTKGTIAEDCIFNYAAGTARVTWTLPSLQILSSTLHFKELPNSTPATRLIEVTDTSSVPLNGMRWKITTVEGKPPVIEMMTKG